jgi:ribose transport system substrate-binding protein
MNARRIAGVAAVALIVALVSAGGGIAGRSSSSAACPVKNGKVKSIAFFGFAAANSFAQATWKGVQQVAKDCGASTKFYDPAFNAQTQVSQIQDAITTGQYQVFVIQANDGNAVVPAVKQAIAKGITVVGEFTPIGPNYATIQPQVPGLIFVGEAPVKNGTSLGQLGIAACKGLTPCKVAYLQGFKSLPLDNARTAAVLKTLKSASNIQVVASPEGGYTQASGLKAAQDVLSAHPDVNVIIGSSQAIEGTQLAVKRAGKLGKIKLIGNGGSCQAITGVLNGTWFASYIIAEKSDGAKATQLGIQAANGGKVPHAVNIESVQNPLGTKSVLQSTHFKAQYCD